MRFFSDNLISIEWWLGVVLVGVLLNLLSAYLKPVLDRIAGALSSGWDARIKRKAEERTRLIAQLRDNPQEQLHVLAEEMRCRLRTISHLVVGVGMVILAFLARPTWKAEIAFWLSLLIIFFALIEFRKAMRFAALVDDARKPC